MDLKGRLFAPYLDAGAGPHGTRDIYNAADGTFEGARLKGRVLPGGPSVRDRRRALRVAE